VLAPLPPPPDAQTAHEIVERMGGVGYEAINVAERVREYLGSGIVNPQSHVISAAMEGLRDDQSIFIAAEDGPLLVSYADMLERNGISSGPDERSYIDLYIDLQAANSYVRYRNGSLWVLLDAVLRHGNPAWIRQRVVRVLIGALAGSRLDFQEAVPLTLLALNARAGTPGADVQFEQLADACESAAAKLTAERERHDTSGSHTRRLATLAQLYARFFNDPSRADALLDRALDPEVFGYAGLYAPASLTLAEAIRICRPADRAAIDEALSKARRSAHRVQDSPFCAQTTARWNALARRWWSQPLDGSALERTIRDLSIDPGDARFTALHLRGEAYNERPNHGPDQLPISNWVLSAHRLAQLADVYERPLGEFERVNPDDDGVQTEVNVPDPEFPPLLAAYLSAEALTVPGLQPSQRAELIQLLVPVAAHNATALDTVLARLLLAAEAAGWVDQSLLGPLEWAGYPGNLPGTDEDPLVHDTGISRHP
jgi:hypothetical protein